MTSKLQHPNMARKRIPPSGEIAPKAGNTNELPAVAAGFGRNAGTP